MSRPTAVIVDPYSSGALLAPAFAEAGVRPVAVVSSPEPPEVYAASYRPGDFDLVIPGGDGTGDVVGRVAALDPICIVTGCESGVELTDALAPRVDPSLANVASLAAARRHKGAMARAVAAAGLPIIPQITTSDPEAVAAWIDAAGLSGRDLVLKPPKSASTDGVVRAPAGRGWREEFDRLLGATNRLGLRNDEVVVQEHLRGTEYVVDTVSWGGEHAVTDICRYRKVDNRTHMAVYDAMDWVAPDPVGHADMIAYATGCLDAVGLRTGPAHIELMMTDAGPYLIELGARAHGGGHPRYCRIATGDSQVDRFVRAATGRGLTAGYELVTNVRVVFLIARATGVVQDASRYDEVRGLASCHEARVHVRDGDRVAATKDLFGTLELGFVVLAHDDARQIEADYAAIRRIESELTVEPDLAGAIT